MSSARARSTFPPRSTGTVASSWPTTAPTLPPPAGPAGWIELARSPYGVARHDEAARIIVMTRLPTPYPDFDTLEISFQRVELTLAHLPRARTALLIDARRAPARNDAAFEQAFAPIRRRIIHGFRRVAVLVETAVGALQVTRHAKIDHEEVGTFTDPAHALEYLEVQMDAHMIDLPDAAPSHHP